MRDFYSKKAKARGLTEEQAEFQVEKMAKLAKSIDDQLATKQDMKLLESTIKNWLRETEERLTYKLTIRLGGLMITGITVLGILITILHH